MQEREQERTGGEMESERESGGDREREWGRQSEREREQKRIRGEMESKRVEETE